MDDFTGLPASHYCTLRSSMYHVIFPFVSGRLFDPFLVKPAEQCENARTEIFILTTPTNSHWLFFFRDCIFQTSLFPDCTEKRYLLSYPYLSSPESHPETFSCALTTNSNSLIMSCSAICFPTSKKLGDPRISKIGNDKSAQTQSTFCPGRILK